MVTLVTEADKKCLKHLFDIPLLMKARSGEERKTILISLDSFEFYGIFHLNACDVNVLLVTEVAYPYGEIEGVCP